MIISFNYVIGAAIESKHANTEAFGKANKIGIKTMRLPIKENLEIAEGLNLTTFQGELNSFRSYNEKL